MSLDDPRLPRILTVANQKEGSGKRRPRSISALLLRRSESRSFSSTSIRKAMPRRGWGIEHRSRLVSTADVLTGRAPLRDAIIDTSVPRLALAPSTLDLLGVELDLAGSRTRRALEESIAGPGRWRA